MKTENLKELKIKFSSLALRKNKCTELVASESDVSDLFLAAFRTAAPSPFQHHELVNRYDCIPEIT